MSAAAHPRTVLLGAAGATTLLLLAAPSPAAALRALAEPASALDPTAPLVALVALVAWGLAAWLLLTVLVTAAAHLPGAAGLVSTALARRVAPHAVRRAVEVALGLTVAVGVIGAPPALASSGPAAAPAAAPSLDWAAAPVQAEPEPPSAQDLDWSATPEQGAAAPPPVSSAVAPSAAAPAGVVVRPGDSLWALAEQDLTSRRGAAPTDAEVAQAWPGWWAANREVVGENPHLLQPGAALTRPASS